MKTKPFATVVVGAFEVNCYLVPSPDKKTLYIIDPGGDAQDIIAAASAFSCQKAVILLTHCHADHIGAVGEVAKRLNITELYIDPADSAMYASPANCFPPYLPAAENLLTPSEWPPQTPDFEILHTPGHTPGGVCYYFREYNALFTGDTLFRASVGRTDFPGGDTATLMESISGRLMTLPDSLEIYPGHGYPSTIGFEKQNNPYL
ncbi:MAG TPA: MBL fold metallo-hydrolase [Lentisphaeria bacterium]|nr:MBL fold metallo-hydrolase [Lentisphaeria bacterium]HCG50438.1 MBL fold metallo-hydrolase [Lentisphaeria bacterium]